MEIQRNDKALYPNTTQVSNMILDNLGLFSEGTLKVALLVTRKTVGWNKETDLLRGSQIEELTGLSKPTISSSVNELIALGVLVRTDRNGNRLDAMPQGFRGEIYYSLNKQLTKDGLVKNLNELNSQKQAQKQLVKKVNQLKKLTSTGKNFLPYKTNSLQNLIKYTPYSPPEGDVDSLFEFYKQASGCPQTMLTPKRKTLIRLRLKLWTIDQIRTAITNCYLDKFHSGDNDRGWKANIDYIFRSDEIMDKLFNLIPAKKGGATIYANLHSDI